MFKQFYENASLLELPVLAMLLFAFTFLVVLVRVLGKRKAWHDHVASLPLDDDTAAAPLSLDGGAHG